MKLKYISNQGIAALKGNLPKNIPQYSAGNKEYFAEFLQKNNYLRETNSEVEDFVSKLWYDDGDNRKDAPRNDVHNAHVIHSALKNLPLPMAIDERIWSCLCHTVLFDFLYKKRGADFQPDQKKFKNKIENTFFTYTSNGKRRGTFVNYISSLWWGAYMVYDEMSSDPYQFLPDIAATGYPSTLVIISSSRILGKKSTCLGFFQVIHDLRGAGEVIDRQDLVEGLKYLNLLAGLTIIDFKSRAEIEEIVKKFYAGYLLNKRLAASA